MRGLKSCQAQALVLVLALALGLFLAGPGTVLASSEGGHGRSEAHGETTPEGGEHHGVTPDKIWNLVFRAMNFGLLFAVLFYLLRKPLKQFLSNRRESIAQTLADLERKKAEAEARFKELEAKISDLEADRERVLAEYIKDGEEEKQKIIANAREMADRIKEQAEVTIDLEIKKAKEDLTREIAEMSASMAEDLIKKNINDQDRERLVEESLKKVVES